MTLSKHHQLPAVLVSEQDEALQQCTSTCGLQFSAARTLLLRTPCSRRVTLQSLCSTQ